MSSIQRQTTPPLTRLAANPVDKKTVDLSTLPGGKPSDNVVGVSQRSPDTNETTTTEVRMKAIVAPVGEQFKVLQIQATGPVIKRDDGVMSERFKTYVVKDAKGRPITDPALARQRVSTQLQNQGMTSMTAEQKQTLDAKVKARAEQTSALATSLQGTGPHTLKAQGITYSNRPDKPNRFEGNTPAPQKLARIGTNVKSSSFSTDGKPTVAVMVVPNLVGEGGMTKGGPAVSLTPQPLTLFIPVSGGSGKDFIQHIESQAALQTTVHNAGFYPGDRDAAASNKFMRENPAQVPEMVTTKIGHGSVIDTKNWWQVYFNTPNMLTPLKGGSVNARAIADRLEVRNALVTQNITTNGRDTTKFSVAPYTWTQLHTKLGIANVAKPNRDAYAKMGVQSELGIYLHNETAPMSSLTGPKNPVKDWHIVNGAISASQDKFTNQFADVHKHSGLEMRSESVIPDWNDRSAGVYVKTPDFAAGGDPSWQGMKARATFDVNGQTFVSATDMAKMLNKLGTEMPKYKELRFVTADTLLKLNRDRLTTVEHPGDGRKVAAFKADSWLNTSARVAVGGPGLFLPKDVAPSK
jgi:hypothetical protein